MAVQKIHESLLWSDTASEDMSSSLNLLAAITSDGEIAVADAGDIAVGCVYEAAALGRQVTVQTGAVMKVKVGTGDLTAGQSVKPEDGGAGVSGSSAGDVAVGIALKSGSEGELVPVLHFPHTVHA